MRRTITIGVLALGAALGCSRSENDSIMVSRDVATGVTAQDQSETRADVDITQQIRKRLVGDGELSLGSRNVKVITAGGVVTLRGPVPDASERERVVHAAEMVAGAENVQDRLDVARP
jgi:osmotically-inducible protein OsmY